MTDDVAAPDLTLAPDGRGADVVGADGAGADSVPGDGRPDASTQRRRRPALITTRRGADALAFSLMLIFVTGAMTLTLMPVVTKDLQDRFGYSAADIGLMTSVFMGFYGVSGILSGVFAARWGGRLLAVSCGCFVVGSAIFGFSSTFAGFLIGTGSRGSAAGWWSPPAAPSWPTRCRRSGWEGPGASLARAGAWATATDAHHAQHRQSRRVPGRLSDNRRSGTGRRDRGTFTKSGEDPAPAFGSGDFAARSGWIAGRRRGQPPGMLLALTNTAALAIGVSLLLWAPSFLQHIHGTSESFSLYLVARAGSRSVLREPPGCGRGRAMGEDAGDRRIADRLRGTPLVGVVPGVVLAFAMVLLTGFFSMFFFAPMLAYIPEVVASPEQVGAATGMNTLMGFSGSLLAPWIFGVFLDAGHKSHGAYIGGFLMLAAFGVAATVGMAFFGAGEAGRLAGAARLMDAVRRSLPAARSGRTYSACQYFGGGGLPNVLNTGVTSLPPQSGQTASSSRSLR